jgi:hypothetical protein
MSEMVERVARALYERQAKLNHYDHSWEVIAGMAKGIADEFRADARTAIEAMREPTPSMRNAIMGNTTEFDVDAVWNDVIDAALK